MMGLFSKTILLLIFTFAKTGWSNTPNDLHCYSNDPHRFLSFGSKTPYRLVSHGQIIEPPNGCQPLQLWMVLHHCTRWMTTNDIRLALIQQKLKHEIMENLKQKRAKLCDEDIELFEEWQVDFNVDKANEKPNLQIKEQYLLGQRIRNSFKVMFYGNVSPNAYMIRHPDNGRTKVGAEYFYKGLTGIRLHEPHKHTKFQFEKDDKLLLAFKNCSALYNNTFQTLELDNFVQGTLMQQLIADVSQRLGFMKLLTWDEIKAMYIGCISQVALNILDMASWCTAFKKEELKILEYTDDIYKFYKSGPGNPLNKRRACHLVKDMFERFSKRKSEPNNRDPYATFYIAYAPVITQLGYALGFAPETAITADNYEQMKDRDDRFRSSVLTPVCGNYLAVLYTCKVSDKLAPSIKVAFYRQEKIIPVPGCPDGICDWKRVQQMYEGFTQEPDCTDETACFESKNTKKTKNELGINRENRVNKTNIFNKHLFIYGGIAVFMFSLLVAFILKYNEPLIVNR